MRILVALTAVGMGLSACGTRAPTSDGPASYAGVNMGRGGGHYKVGVPYTIYGVRYAPREDFTYVAEGEASWYGPGFHGRPTANGERYDMYALTAAHPTLQIPSIARVTNLENGRSVVVRINDRGPFAHNRLIDLSRAAAEEIDMVRQGIARVRVEVLTEESIQVAMAEGRSGPAPSVPGRRPATTAVAAAPPTPARGHAASAPASAAPVPAATRPTAPASVAAPVPPPAQPAPRQPEPAPAMAPVMSAATLPPQPAPASTSAPVPATAAARAAAEPAPPFRLEEAYRPAETPIYVEAGPFTVYDNATSAFGEMSALGPSAIDSRTVGGITLHTVRLGPFGSAVDADYALGMMQRAGLTDTRVVHN